MKFILVEQFNKSIETMLQGKNTINEHIKITVPFMLKIYKSIVIESENNLNL